MSGVLEFRGDELREADGQAAEWPRLLLFGDPVAHSSSPRMHRAALRAARLPGEYRAVRVDSHELPAAARAAFDAGVDGVNLTVPHKLRILDCVDRSSEEVVAIGAANTLLRGETGWNAHNTDARGFALALQGFLGRELREAVRRVSIIGAGGAARAVAAAIRSFSAEAELQVLARRPEAASWCGSFRAKAVPLLPDGVADSTLIVQATPLGLRATDPSPLTPVRYGSSCVAVDLVYARHRTRFLQDAIDAGCRCEDGTRMLIAQAALAFTMWFGGESPLEVMAKALDFDW